MGNKRISDLNRAESLLGTEEAVVDQVADTISGFDTRKTTLSSIQEFTLSGAPFLKVTGETTFSNNAFLEAGTTLSGNDACFVGVSAIGTGPNRGQLFAESGVIAGPKVQGMLEHLIFVQLEEVFYHLVMEVIHLQTYLISLMQVALTCSQLP